VFSVDKLLHNKAGHNAGWAESPILCKKSKALRLRSGLE